MARMIPDFVSDECKSSAERRLFERFRKELPDSCAVLHSLGVARHRYKLYSEADFVFVHQQAILVFEVKGGRLERRDGAWFFTDRYGAMHKRRESPMQQASSVTAAIRNSVSQRFGALSPQATVAFGGVSFFPDIVFAEVSPEWDLRRVYDLNAWNRPLRETVSDAVRYARSEMARITNHEPAALTPEQMQTLLEFLRGDFDKVPSLSVAIAGHEQQMVYLAAQQYVILDQTAKNTRMVIEGPAGTGKTLIAMECARRHAAEGRRVLFVCFSKLLAKHLNLYATRNGQSTNLSIGTLHNHCLSVLREAKIEIDPGIGEHELYSEEIPRRVTEALTRLSGLKPWDVLVVDEGQDIASHGPFMLALEHLLFGGFRKGRWIWFEDPNQRILRQGAATPLDLQIYSPSYFQLTRNWRNTNEVATFTSVATRFPLPGLSGIGGPIVRKVLSETSNCLRALENLILDLLRLGGSAEDFLLLTAVAEHKAVFCDAPTVAGLKLVRYDPACTAVQGEIRYSSVYKFKGLEAKVVILTDVDDLSGDNGRMAAYVGMSRANSALCVFLSQSAHRHFEDNRLAFGDAAGTLTKSAPFDFRG